ncbi:Hexokinase [Penicillium maclennaniae]|uniref:Hexokinase n=1 Tax=Penicillium maclennaniae TaxID=1343394 RepID=UPI00253F7B76|nr:Hexokinase [Penicillium maclennaniae]KAJ5670163.1 Hexokinase [Penicillium maclennaniae]
MVGVGPKQPPSRKGSMQELPQNLLEHIKRFEDIFTVDAAQLKKIVKHFVSELEKGLTVEGGNIPMNVTWVMGFPDGEEQGTYLALDMGGTNLRVCEITLTDKKGGFDITQSEIQDAGRASYRYRRGVVGFVEFHHENENLSRLPLGFTFSYPATQDYIDHGVLQRWTKGFDIDGVEGEDVVPPLEAILKKRGLPIKVAALINDTTGTLIASAYTDPEMKIGCIFGTGVNAAYMENVGSVPKIAHLNLPPDMPIAINCEYGAFDNERVVLPLTKFDEIIDRDSPRPGQQAFEKMTAGLYLGEIFRLALKDLLECHPGTIFNGQNTEKLNKPYLLDASFLAAIEEDPYENLSETFDKFHSELGIRPTRPELEMIRRLAELIGTRAARLSSCGVAAICTKKKIDSCHVGADGSVFTKYPHFKARGAQALREMLDWAPNEKDKVEIMAAEDGSGVGAALIAALTLKRVKAGNLVGIRNMEEMRTLL